MYRVDQNPKPKTQIEPSTAENLAAQVAHDPDFLMGVIESAHDYKGAHTSTNNSGEMPGTLLHNGSAAVMPGAENVTPITQSNVRTERGLELAAQQAGLAPDQRLRPAA